MSKIINIPGNITIYTGDCLESLRQIPSESVNCCVTSPPYFGLRDYNHIDQIGQELTPDEFVNKLVKVFREVRRVLTNDGTLWLNLGDSYAGSGKGLTGGMANNPKNAKVNGMKGERVPLPTGCKRKDLIGIPWMVAFALRADGWYLRSDIVWQKTNPMPESVRDRPTKSHEYIFLLTKSEAYFYDAEAIAETTRATERSQLKRARELFKQNGLTNNHLEAIRSCGITDTGKAAITQSGTGKNLPEIEKLAKEAKTALGGYYREFFVAATRNARSVWNIATKPYKGAHFATFPEELPQKCILAGCPKDGVVLDPFGGSGTTADVARKLGRKGILCELNSEYVELIQKRLCADQQILF